MSTSRRDEILDAAAALLADGGPDGLTMRRLADAIGVQAPSLYKHVTGKPDVLAGLQERALRAMAAALAPTRSLRALGAAYRAWALANPALYDLATRYPLARDRLTPGVEEAAAAPVLRCAGGDRTKARLLWAAAHGLVDLERAGRFPADADIDAAWAALGRSLGQR